MIAGDLLSIGNIDQQNQNKETATSPLHQILRQLLCIIIGRRKVLKPT